MTATRKGTVSKVDAAQAMKNIQQLITTAHSWKEDTVSTMVDNNIVGSQLADTTLMLLEESNGKVSKKDVLPITPGALVKGSNHHPVTFANGKALIKMRKKLNR